MTNILICQIDATEDFLRLQLDISRNNLWKVDVMVGMATMWISLALLISSIAGMNVHMGGENMVKSPYDHTPFSDCGNCKHGDSLFLSKAPYAHEGALAFACFGGWVGGLMRACVCR